MCECSFLPDMSRQRLHVVLKAQSMDIMSDASGADIDLSATKMPLRLTHVAAAHVTLQSNLAILP